MQVTLRAWHGQSHSHCHPRCYLWGPGPLGQLRALTCLQPPKEAVGATPSLTHRQTALHPNQSSRPWLSLPDKNIAGISHGSQPILWVSRTTREDWLLIRAVAPLPGDSTTTLRSGTGRGLGEVGMYNNHYGNTPLWSRIQVSQSEATF